MHASFCTHMYDDCVFACRMRAPTPVVVFIDFLRSSLTPLNTLGFVAMSCSFPIHYWTMMSFCTMMLASFCTQMEGSWEVASRICPPPPFVVFIDFFPSSLTPLVDFGLAMSFS